MSATLTGYQFTELKRAYEILGAAPDASAHSIKHAYRRLIKRWHPDRYQAGAPAHAEATSMTGLINEAYSAIAHAPLRYHTGAPPREGAAGSKQGGEVPSAGLSGKAIEEFPTADRLEFWVRFVCGAVFGVSISLDLAISVMPDSFNNLTTLAAAILGAMLACGWAASRYGDKFWHSVLRRWWLWP